jgi:hypothetical protein
VNENDAIDPVTALFEGWSMPLIRYALRTTANYELAEDLAQDTFTGTNSFLHVLAKATSEIPYSVASFCIGCAQTLL